MFSYNKSDTNDVFSFYNLTISFIYFFFVKEINIICRHSSCYTLQLVLKRLMFTNRYCSVVLLGVQSLLVRTVLILCVDDKLTLFPLLYFIITPFLLVLLHGQISYNDKSYEILFCNKTLFVGSIPINDYIFFYFLALVDKAPS